MALRRYYLPLEDDTEDSLATALWLAERETETTSIAVTNGIAKAFNGNS